MSPVYHVFVRERVLIELYQALLVLKYVTHAYEEQFTYYGYACVSQNTALMLSAIVLWMSQSVGSEYEYNLSI